MATAVPALPTPSLSPSGARPPSPAGKAHPAGRFGRAVWWVVAGAVAVGLTAAGARTLSARAAAPVHYETAAVDRGGIDAKVTASGAVSALVTVQVGSQVSGRIEALFADFNSPVKNGQVIATIEPSLFRAAVEQARATQAVARANREKSRAQAVEAERVYVRAEALNRDGLASHADLDVAEANARVARAEVAAAEAQLAQAHAALEQSELNLRWSTIVSPIDGVVISRNVDVGQTVAAALTAPTLFTIAQDLGKMQVDTNVAEADIGKIRPQMAVTFTVDAYPTRVFAGAVRQVRDAAITVQNVVTYDAVIDVDNAEHLLKPGMTANVTFVHARKADVLRVPNAALRFKPDAATVALMTTPPGRAADARAARPAPIKLATDERVVWVVRGGRATPVTVKVGITDGSSTEVVAGDLREGDTAVDEALTEGARKP